MKTIIDFKRLVVTWHPAASWDFHWDTPCGCRIFSIGKLEIELLGKYCLERKNDE